MSRRWKLAVVLILAVTLLTVSFYLDSTKFTISIVGTIPVGVNPRIVAVDSIKHRVYVANPDSSIVSVIDTVNDTAVASVQIGEKPYLIAVNPETKTVYVATYAGVYVINGTDNEVITTLPFGEDGAAIFRVDSSSNKIYLIALGTMYVIDGSTNKVVNAVDMGEQYKLSNPGGLDIDPETHQILITESYAGGLWIVNASSLKLISRSPHVGNRNIIVDRKLNRIYAFIHDPFHHVDQLNILDQTTYEVIAKIHTFGNSVSVDNVRNRVYMLDCCNKTLTILDGRSGQIMGSFQLGFQPGGMDLDISTGRIYATDPKAGNLVILQVQK